MDLKDAIELGYIKSKDTYRRYRQIIGENTGRN